MYCSGQVFIYSMSGPQADVVASQEITEIQVQYTVQYIKCTVYSIKFTHKLVFSNLCKLRSWISGLPINIKYECSYGIFNHFKNKH